MKKRQIACVAGAMIMAASMAMPVSAATTYTAVTGNADFPFQKILVMDDQANVPNAIFTYTIAPGTAKAYSVGDKHFEVLAGVGTPIFKAGTDQDTGTDGYNLKFAPGDAKITKEVETNGGNTHQVKGLQDGESFAVKEGHIDFSGCSFTEPGVYRYVLTETNTTNQAITNDTDATRTIDVFVVDDNGTLKVQSTVLHADDTVLEMSDSFGTNIEDGSTTYDSKSQGYTNRYDTADLTIRKEVSGNQASKDKYFEFTLEIEGAKAGTVYDVILDNADATSGSNAATITANSGKTNPSQLTVGSNGKLTQKFYLQHGQQIEIQGIAKDTKYTVTENSEDYKSEANTKAGTPKVTTQEGTVSADTTGKIGDVTKTVAALGNLVVSDDLTTGYLNTRQGTIPTGVMVAVAPFAAIAAAGGIGAASMAFKKKKEDNE